MAYAYGIADQGGMYFITCTVVKWVDIFTRRAYADLVVDSLNYCVEHKGLKVYGYVIMSNHIHLIIQAKEENLSDVLRDFKKFTSQSILRAIEDNPVESRKSWMLWLFRQAGSDNIKNAQYQFWQPSNQGEACFTLKFTWQKLNYIHNNPVRSGVVNKAEEYIYSSAADYTYGKQVGKVKMTLLDFLQTTYS